MPARVLRGQRSDARRDHQRDRSPSRAAILDDLDANYPKWRDKRELGSEVLGINAGGTTLGSYLSNLRTAGLIEENGSVVRLHPDIGEAA
jgi:hypothetical protein